MINKTIVFALVPVMKTELKNIVGRMLLTSLIMTAIVKLRPIISQRLCDFLLYS